MNKTTDSQAAQAGSSSEPIFDPVAMSTRLMDDKELIQTVAQAFLADMPNQIEQIKAAIAADDIELATAHAHKIKGATANISGMALSAQALHMELAGKAGDMDTLRKAMPELEQGFAQLKASMEASLF